MGSAPAPPPVPNAGDITQQGLAANKATAQFQAGLNNVSQSGWGGGVQYTKNPDGTYSLKQSLNPTVQNTVESNLNKFNSQPGPVDPSGAIDRAVSMERQYLSPYFNQQTQQLDSTLKSQGFVPGTEGYDNAMRATQQGQEGTLAGYASQFEPLAYSQSMASYLTPLQVAQGAYSGLNFTPTQTPQTAVSPVDTVGAYGVQAGAQNANYAAQSADYQAKLAGLFSIPAAFAGGAGRWAGGKFG